MAKTKILSEEAIKAIEAETNGQPAHRGDGNTVTTSLRRNNSAHQPVIQALEAYAADHGIARNQAGFLFNKLGALAVGYLEAD